MYLKISPMKGVVRFVQKGKLFSRYVGHYEISQRVGKVAYDLMLPGDWLQFICFSMFLLLKSVSLIVSIFFLLRVLV